MQSELNFYSSFEYISHFSGSSTSSHSLSTVNSGISRPLSVLTSNYDVSGTMQMRQKSTISKF